MKASMSSAVLNAPGLSRRVPSGKVPRCGGVGAQWRPGRTAISKLVSRMRRGPAGDSAGSGTTSESAPTWRVGVPAAGDLPAVGEPRPSRQRAWSRSTSWRRMVSGPRSATQAMPAARPATPRTFGVPLRGSREDSSGCVSLDESPPVPPSRQAGASAAGRRRARRCRSGRRATCGRGTRAGRSHRLQVDRHDARRLRRIDEEQAARLADDRPDLLDRLHGAEHVAGVRQGDQPGLRRQARRRRRGRGSRRRDASRVSGSRPPSPAPAAAG